MRQGWRWYLPVSGISAIDPGAASASDVKLFAGFSRLFPLWVILGSAAAFAVPELVLPAAPLLRGLFIATMFCTGMVLHESELNEIRRNPWPVAGGVSLQFLIMPLAAFAISRLLPLEPIDQLGLILAGAVPGAMASNTITYLAGGDVAFSVAMTVVSTALAPVLTPLLTGFYSGTAVSLDTGSMMFDIFLTVVLPVAAGYTLRYFFTEQVVQIEPVLASASVFSITGIIAIVTAQNAGRIVSVGAMVVLAVILVNGTGYLLGYLGARLGGLDRRRRLTVAIEIGMQNAGLSTVLASRYISPEAALAGSFYTVWCVITGSLLSPFRREAAADRQIAELAATAQEKPVRMSDTPEDDNGSTAQPAGPRRPINLPGNPVILERSEHPVSRKSISPEAQKVLYRLRSEGYRAFLVGGSVRDLLLGRKPKDFDVATDASPRQVARLFRNARVIGRRFRVVHVRFGRDTVIEVATFRATPKPGQGDDEQQVAEEFAGDEADEFMHDNAMASAPIGDDLDDEPTETDALRIVAEAAHADEEDDDTEDESNVEDHSTAVQERRPRPSLPHRETGENPHLQWDDNVFGTAEEDAFRRDLSINGLFYDIDSFCVIDYVGGLDDLRHRLIRTIGDPNVRFLEDPVRMIRAIRHAARVGFRIEDNTWEAIKIHHEQIKNCSRARVLEEFLRELSRGSSHASLTLLEKTGLLRDILPPLADALGPCPGENDHQKRAWRRFEVADQCYQRGELPEELAYTVAVAPYNDDLVDAISSPDFDVGRLPGVLTQAGERIGEINRRLAVPRRLGIPAVNIYLNFMLLRRGLGTGRMNARLVTSPQRMQQSYPFYAIDALARGEQPRTIEDFLNMPRQKKRGSNRRRPGRRGATGR